MSSRRARPSYLTKEEAARDYARLRDMVRSISGTSARKLGETDNFIVTFIREKKLMVIYGKEVPRNIDLLPFMLRFSLGQAVGICELLKKAMGVMQGTEKVKIGEESGFVVEYDGKNVMLYGTENQTEYPLKLTFDKDDITRIISLLRGCFLEQASGVQCPECHKTRLIRTDDGHICFECGHRSRHFRKRAR